MGCGADSIGHGEGHPHFYNFLGTGPPLSRTANSKLTKLYWPSRKRSPKRLIFRPLRAKKSGGARQKNFLKPLCAGPVPPSPHFQIRSGTAGYGRCTCWRASVERKVLCIYSCMGLVHTAVFENTYFTFFGFKKVHDFTCFEVTYPVASQNYWGPVDIV